MVGKNKINSSVPNDFFAGLKIGSFSMASLKEPKEYLAFFIPAWNGPPLEVFDNDVVSKALGNEDSIAMMLRCQTQEELLIKLEMLPLDYDWKDVLHSFKTWAERALVESINKNFDEEWIILISKILARLSELTK
jgi:hypothetical protein